MKVTPGFDPRNKKITLEFQTNLLKKYYPNFEGMITTDSSIPSGTNVQQTREDTAVITFPVQKNTSIKNDSENGVGYIAVEPENMEIFGNVINKFVNAALRREFKTTEFIPLEGYPIEKLRTEIRSALENKRNFCIIDTYENYLKLTQKNNYEFNQAILEFGSTDYAKTAVLVYRGDIEGLRKMWSERLKLDSWN